MVLNTIDWSIIIIFFAVSLLIGIAVAKRSGANTSEFFLSGRNMPWWLLGISMVATTFSADTPNLVTDIVRNDGVSGNWKWWAFLLTGMLTVFVYAKLWRRSKVLTDLEFYELRYSGKKAAFLRGFRALYLGFFFNIMIMATVSLAAIKIGGVLLGLSPVKTLLIASVITVVYSILGGLRGVVLTDFFQFFIAMVGAIWAAKEVVGLPEIGGLQKLLSNANITDKLQMIPDISDKSIFISLLVIPLAVQWWSVWYPGAEPGGGGYIAQRMLSAKNEKNAVWATLLFNVTHYALRPWPWIIIALCSLVVFPDLQSIRDAFPNVDPSVVKNDLAYPAMLTFLPGGLLGLVIASLIAAYMSTISTHLNWGSSYVVNDFYQRFIHPEATDKELVAVGRVAIVILMLFSAMLALLLSNALQAFDILLQIGAGTGLLFILRWFWYRINAYSEITAMIASFLFAVYLRLIHPRLGFEEIDTHVQLILGVGLTTLSWIIVTLLTKPTDKYTLRIFYRLIRPGGPGWKKVLDEAEKEGEPLEAKKEKWDVPTGILCMLVGCFAVYGMLFSTGYWIYGEYTYAFALTAFSLVAIAVLTRLWKRLQMD